VLLPNIIFLSVSGCSETRSL